MKLTTTFLMLMLGTLTIYQAGADSLRCGDKLVNVGDSEYELLDRCGEPSAREDNGWVYERGSGELTMIVKVSEGVVRSIQTELSENP